MKSLTPLHFARHFARYALRGGVQHLVVHVTNHCNLRCEHCFVDFTPKRDLPLESYRRLAREVGPLFHLDVGGGEPFLRKDLPEIVASFDARVVHVPTNGSLGARMVPIVERMRDLSSAEIGIALSLDGRRETHDRIRARPGSFDEVWTAFDLLRGIEGIAVYVNTVLTLENADEMLDLMDEVFERRPDFHAVTLLRGGPVEPRTRYVPLERLERLGPEILRRAARYDEGGVPVLRRLGRNYHRYLWDLSLRTIAEQRQVVPCLGGRAHAVVWGDGGVSSCEMLPVVGNVEEASFGEIVGSDAMRAQVAGVRRGDCHCTHNCALYDSIMFRPASLARLLHQPLRRPTTG
ncbi:MAG: radical SAM protein [Planctomycetota bacterium]